MKIPKWVEGRQGGGYERLTLLRYKFVDMHILRMFPGSVVPPHTDKLTDGRKHYRANLILQAAKCGGQFIASSTIFSSNRLFIFRPDESEHEVTTVIEGTRYVLSLGWATQQTS